MRGTAVVVGRFQTPYLHKGHRALLEHALNSYDKVIVFIGCHPVPVTKDHPMDFMTRYLMVSEYLGPSAIIMPIMDHPSDEVWSNNLDSMIKTVCPFDEITLLCGRDGFTSHYIGTFQNAIKELDFGHSHLSATEIRENLAKAPANSEDFRAGVVYASQHMYPRVSPTVDIVVYKFGKTFGETEVLLARKPGRDKWCFVGGFVDIIEHTLEDAAIRELQEETGLSCAYPSYVTSQAIDDWRNTKSNSIMTSLFIAKYLHGHPVANDDIEDVKWFKLHTLKHELADHHVILEKDLINALLKKFKEVQNETESHPVDGQL